MRSVSKITRPCDCSIELTNPLNKAVPFSGKWMSKSKICHKRLECAIRTEIRPVDHFRLDLVIPSSESVRTYRRLIRTAMRKLRRIAWLVLFASIAIAVLAGLYLLSTVEDSRDLVRLRNAVIFDVKNIQELDWTPQEVPTRFLWDTGAPSKEIKQAARRFAEKQLDGDSARHLAIRIAGSLADHASRSGRPIQSNTTNAYRQITENGLGYCSDFTQVMNGLLLAANVPIREWGMSFDRFGGDGHAFSEIYDKELAKWIFIDSFYSFFVTDNLGTPLSVAEFRAALRKNALKDVRLVVINQNGFRMPSSEYALKYYADGSDELFMYWGNNVASYDSNVILKNVGRYSRSLEQIAAIILGLLPRIAIIPTAENKNDIAYLNQLRWAIFTFVGAGFMAIFAGGFLIVNRFSRHRK